MKDGAGDVDTHQILKGPLSSHLCHLLSTDQVEELILALGSQSDAIPEGLG